MLTNRYPELAETLFTKGVAQLRDGNRQEAIASFDRVLQFAPNNADAYGHRCVARHRAGDLPGAISDCQRAATLHREQRNIESYQYALKMLDKLQAMTTLA
jgi:Flp pilus assembly protein TadD